MDDNGSHFEVQILQIYICCGLLQLQGSNIICQQKVGNGVGICQSVPADVQAAAYEATHKKQEAIPPIGHDTVSNIVELEPEGRDLLDEEMDDWIERMGWEELMFFNEAGGSKVSQGQGGYLSDMVDTENLTGSRTMEGVVLTGQVSVLEEQGTDFSEGAMENLADSFARGACIVTAERRVSEGLHAHRAKGEPLLTRKLVGQASDRNMEMIWSWLMKDDVLSVGIYGMGGVGKTSLVTHIHNQLLQRPSSFNYVFWVTVTQNFTISKLQYLIAKAIYLDLSNEEDEKKRAAKLSKALIAKGKSVLILDDLWDRFPLKTVGIPVEGNACKLILTTRSLEVCRRMGCQKSIKVDLLTEEEAWTLFVEKLGHYATLSPEVVQIAESVAAECSRLPLGIIAMAGSMRGVDDLHEWRNALTELKQSEVRVDDMEPEVFHILRFSYMRLSDSALQQCLLYCAFFPEDFTVDREDLIGYLIDEGIIQPMNSRQEEFDEGQAMLNKLENACLLESYFSKYNYRFFKMHDLIRDMALQKLRENSPVMVEGREQQKELPDEGEWTEEVVRVSLMENYYKEIPSGYSPMCPKLSTLFLSSNVNLEMIADSFFKHFQGLKVLELSGNVIRELPSSFSNLVNLTALYLRRCEMLRHIPSLAKLRELRKLDLRYTALEELPLGMEMLSNLRYLNLYGNNLKKLPAGILHHLSQLQFLSVNSAKGIFETVRVEEVACLKRYQFCDLDEYKKFLNYPEVRQPLTSYIFIVGVAEYIDDILHMTPEEAFYKEVLLHDCDIDERGRLLELPEDVSALTIGRCNDARSLCDVSPFKHATSLKSFVMRECDRIECLVSISESSTDIFENLEILSLNTLMNFCVFIAREGAAPPPWQSNGTFSRLKRLRIGACPSMKNLLSLDLLPNLTNLEVIEVDHCNQMEAIIAIEDEEEGVMVGGSSNQSAVTHLPNLKALRLSNLPELKSIFHGELICDSLEEILVVNCPELRRISLSHRNHFDGLTPLRKIQAYPEEWWDAVEWGNSNSKNALQHLCSNPYNKSSHLSILQGQWLSTSLTVVPSTERPQNKRVKYTDPFWDYVDKTNIGGRFKCKFCKFTFAATTSISRFKYHLSGESGKGANICGGVPADVQADAYRAMHKKRKAIPPIGYGVPNVEPQRIEQQGRDPADMEMEDPIGSTGRVINEDGGSRTSQGQGGYRSNMVDTENLTGSRTMEVGVPEEQGTDVSDGVMEDLIDNFASGASIVTEERRVSEVLDAHKAEGELLLTTTLVGQVSDKNMETILSWLMNDDVLNVGIYGIGGVGKTSLVTLIHNQLLERPSSFNYVFWVTVTQDFNITKLQYLIAKAINLDLSNEEDEEKRAAKLSKALVTKGKSVLILDDLWNDFFPEKVGIPLEMNACNLILTTRSLDVCQKMGCQKSIRVELLTEEESWTLFVEKLGHYDTLSTEVVQIAKSVAAKCACLPRKIIEMAESMMGVDDLHEWRNALRELNQTEVRVVDMEPEDFTVDREDLIGYLIYEGIYNSTNEEQAGRILQSFILFHQFIYYNSITLSLEICFKLKKVYLEITKLLLEDIIDGDNDDDANIRDKDKGDNNDERIICDEEDDRN
uniref:BED-type domain-containing protein n=1 Tax=Salix viminalis TaxID=40686 RepID=A0A6N2MS66_SALVM